MQYICYDYYVSHFGGSAIPADEFDYLASAASTIIDILVTSPIREITNNIRLAAVYQAEVLFAQGGVDAIGGLAAITSGIDERIGDYSIGTPYVSNEKRCYSIGGVPVSGLTLSLLKKEGLMTRCVYQEGEI